MSAKTSQKADDGGLNKKTVDILFYMAHSREKVTPDYIAEQFGIQTPEACHHLSRLVQSHLAEHQAGGYRVTSLVREALLNKG